MTYNKEYYRKNKERYREYHQKYHAKNKDRRSQYGQEYYQRNKEARRQYCQEYYLKNRDKILQRTNQRRADNIDIARQHDRERRKGKGWLKLVKIEFLEGKYCEICTENRVLELAHIIPRNGQKNKWWKDLGSNRIMVLCPTHHKLFDNHLLSENEYEKIREKVEKAHGMVEYS